MLAVVSGNGRGQMPTVNAHWRHGLLDSDQRRPRDHPDCPETGKQRRVVCVVTMPATFPPLLSRRPYPAQRSPTSSHILTSSPPVSSSLNNVTKPPQCWPVLPYYYLSPAQDLEPPLGTLKRRLVWGPQCGSYQGAAGPCPVVTPSPPPLILSRDIRPSILAGFIGHFFPTACRLNWATRSLLVTRVKCVRFLEGAMTEPIRLSGKIIDAFLTMLITS